MATFVVETGEGLANANSYMSVAEADAYHSNHGNPSDWKDRQATATLTFEVNPTAGQAFAADGIVYTFAASVVAVGSVLIGATPEETARNLAAAINFTGPSGTWYNIGGANPKVTASASGKVVTITAIALGVLGNGEPISSSVTLPNDLSSSTLSGGYDSRQEALRLATAYLDRMYGRRWVERRTQEYQSLDWPRAFVTDGNGFPLRSDVVPARVKEACAYLALAVIRGDNLMPDQSASDRSIQSTSVKVGPVSKAVVYGPGGKSTSKRYHNVDAMLSEFLNPPGTLWMGG